MPERLRSTPDAVDIDITWELDGIEVVVALDDADLSPARARASMPTVPDEDPLRYDIAYQRAHAARDSLPSLPVTWELEGSEVVLDADGDRISQEDMRPTLYDVDPLRYDVAYQREHRDSLPSLPEIDSRPG